MLRTAVTRQARLFATSPALQRGPVQAGKDALKTVDRAVADTLVKGIETGGTFSFLLPVRFPLTLAPSSFPRPSNRMISLCRLLFIWTPN